MMSTWHSMWLDNSRICDVLQDLICVPDVLISVMRCTRLHFSVYMTLFQIAKLIFLMPFGPFQFLLSSFFYIYWGSFCRLFTEHRTSLDTSSPPATSVHQDDTLTYAVFVLETLSYFLLLAYVSLGASNFVLVSHF